MPTSMAARHFTLDSGQQSNIVSAHAGQRLRGPAAGPRHDLPRRLRWCRTTGVVWSGGLVTLLGDFGFSTGASRVALARMVRRGGLERLARAAGSSPTARRRAPSRCWRRATGGSSPWAASRTARSSGRRCGTRSRRSGAWSARRLARRLRFLGFGSVQDGMWISPARPRAGGRRADRRRSASAGTPGSWSAVPPPGSTSPRSPRARGTSTRSTPDTARSSTSSHRPPLPPAPTSTRRSGCAPGSCTCSAASRRSTPSFRTS